MYVRIISCMRYASSRAALLAAGRRIMFNSGFHGASVRDIVRGAGAAQGSFTNHFRSKEAFAQEVVADYTAYVQTLMQQTLCNRNLTPVVRLQQYFDTIIARLAADEWQRGCLVGDFSLEIPNYSQPLRMQLQQTFAEWRQVFAACIAEGQADGSIRNKQGAADLAEFVLASWQGAMLRMKVERSPAPLHRFKKIIFETIITKE